VQAVFDERKKNDDGDEELQEQIHEWHHVDFVDGVEFFAAFGAGGHWVDELKG
jgi:hypothetical protein